MITGYLSRGMHQIYWEQQGNPDGVPVVIVHGGPGGQINPRWGEFFDPKIHRLIFFDQRGCGQSKPFGLTQENNVASLVEDMEALRETLGIKKWFIFGGSWGTTLALLYGVAYPTRCLGFLLRGVWLARTQDIEWFLWGSRIFYPTAHAHLLETIEQACGRRPENASELIFFANQILENSHNIYRQEVAQAWSGYEYHISSLKPMHIQAHDPALITIALMESHYLSYELPLKKDLLESVSQSPIIHLPCQIVHGQYDMVCPVDEAIILAQVWQNAELSITLAGHATFEIENEKALHSAAKILTTRK